MTKHKKEVKDIPVELTEEVVTDLEESPIKEVVYTFQTLGYVFMLGAIASAIFWFIYLAQWVTKIYNDQEAYSTMQTNGEATGSFTFPERRESWSFEVTTLCFQGLVASCLLYFVFRHHYRHH